MKFKKIYIEITNICNLKCSFCPLTIRKKEYMSITNFEYIINQIKNFTKYIYLHIKGEPLLHPYIKDILNICDKYQIKVNITTNGTLIRNDINNDCLNQINFSIHSLEDNKKEEYLNNILDYIDHKNENTYISLRFWNIDHFDNKEILKKIENHYKFDILNNIKNGLKIKDKVYLNIDKSFIWPSLNTKEETNGYCLGGKSHIGILVDGTVVPCCLDQDGIINLGNIFNNNLEDILNSKKYKEIINNFNNNKCSEELCKKMYI